MSRPDIEGIHERLEAACNMVADLCDGKRDWIMSIPARPDYDPDLVIGKSQGDLRALLDYVAELEGELAKHEEPLPDLDALPCGYCDGTGVRP